MWQRRRASAHPVLLWVDDYKPGLELYRAMFEALGFRVFTASSGEEALQIAALHHIDVVVTDYEMPGMNGEAVAIAIRTLQPKTPIVLFSGSTLIPARARKLADAVCDKAGSRHQLSSTIHRVLLRKRSRGLQPPPVARASESHRTVA
jgi:CheY-like chemotaxis protein